MLKFGTEVDAGILIKKKNRKTQNFFFFLIFKMKKWECTIYTINLPIIRLLNKNEVSDVFIKLKKKQKKVMTIIAFFVR